MCAYAFSRTPKRNQLMALYQLAVSWVSWFANALIQQIISEPFNQPIGYSVIKSGDV